VISDAKRKELDRLRHIRLRGEELLVAALAGREKSPETVVRAWLMASEACCDSGLRPSQMYAVEYERYWEACSAYLRASDWSRERLETLKSATPWWGGSVLDELGESLDELDKLSGEGKP
jgi:hypothetical protein